MTPNSKEGGRSWSARPPSADEQQGQKGETAWSGVYRPHPLAELFPLMEGQTYRDLVEDVRAHGIREPVVRLDGMVLDGRNRYLAARECGRSDIPTTEFQGTDPLAFVISRNLRRRHLSESQRALVAAKIARLEDGKKQVGKFADVPTQAQAADMLNVSERSVRHAREVHEHATPALIAEVEAGRVSVSAAAALARLPDPEQHEIVTDGPAAIRKAAATRRKAPKVPCAPVGAELEISPGEPPATTHAPLAAALIAVIAERNASGGRAYVDPVSAAETDRADIARAARMLADRCEIHESASLAEKALTDVIMQIVALVGPWRPPARTRHLALRRPA